ncbi:putative Nodulin-like [Trypanosoma cruzi]|nr:putative Nodulin-like [Trypanosoma cruzi]
MVQLVDDLFRMRMLMAGVYLALGTSSNYCFSIFTDHLRNKYGYSQSDITTIGTVGDFVSNFGFHAGVLFDYVGPTVLLPVGGLFGCLGFVLFGMTFDGKISNSSVALFALYQGITSLGLPMMDVSSVMSLMLQIPLERGYVVIIVKTFSGLGTAVLVAYFNGWFKAANSEQPEENNYSGYAYFVGGQILLCSLIGACFTRLPMYFPCSWRKKRLSSEEAAEREKTLDLYMSQHAPTRRLRTGFAIVIATLIFSTTQSITTAYVNTSRAGYLAISIVAVLLMASFSVIAMPFQFLGRYTPVCPTHMEGIGIGKTTTEPMHERTDETASESAVAGGNNLGANGVAVPAPQYSGSFWSHLLTVELWAVWLACFGAFGTASVMQMNAAQIYRSMNNGKFDTRTLTLYVAIISVGSAVGRMAVGYLDMKLFALQCEGKTKILTTIALPIGPLLLVAACLFFAVLPGSALLPPFLLGAMGNGVGWGMSVIALRIMYSEDIGKHYNFCFTSGAIASIGLNRFMFGEMYDAEARRRGEFPSCNHPSCVRSQMFILLFVDVVATLAAAFVHWRFSRFTRAKPDVRETPDTFQHGNDMIGMGSGDQATEEDHLHS